MNIWEEEKQSYIKAAMGRNTAGENETLKKALQEIDWSILDNITRKETVNERGVFAPLEAVEVGEIEARGAEFKEIGLASIRRGEVGAVLLAGGQGTRLGLDKPKGTLKIGVDRELYLFEQLIRNLQDVTDEAGVYVPLYVMTSNINHDDTVSFFEEHQYFGYPKEYVRFFVQEMVPACDYEGRVYMESDTGVAMSPNGNGGWFGSMVKLVYWRISMPEESNGLTYLQWITAYSALQTRCLSVQRLHMAARAVPRLCARQHRMRR